LELVDGIPGKIYWLTKEANRCFSLRFGGIPYSDDIRSYVPFTLVKIRHQRPYKSTPYEKNVSWEIIVNGRWGYLAPYERGQIIHIQEITPKMCKNIGEYRP